MGLSFSWGRGSSPPATEGGCLKLKPELAHMGERRKEELMGKTGCVRKEREKEQKRL